MHLHKWWKSVFFSSLALLGVVEKVFLSREDASLITNIFLMFLFSPNCRKNIFEAEIMFSYIFAFSGKRRIFSSAFFWHNQKSFVCLLHDQRKMLFLIWFHIGWFYFLLCFSLWNTNTFLEARFAERKK